MAPQAMFLVIDMTSMARVGPALATVTKRGLCLELLIIHLTLISTQTYWIFQTDTSNPALQVHHQPSMTLLVFLISLTIIMDPMDTTSNHFILPILYRLLVFLITLTIIMDTMDTTSNHFILPI